MFEAGLYNLLASNPGIMAQVGGSPFARADGASGVFPVQLPEASVLPACVYTVLHGQSVNSVQGTNRLEFKRLQVDCYGRHYGDAKNMMKVVMDCLLSYRGPLSDGTFMAGALKVAEIDAFEDAPFLYRGVVDFSVHITNPAE
jgi:hypothetical protein